jgi:hypothetical protein
MLKVDMHKRLGRNLDGFSQQISTVLEEMIYLGSHEYGVHGAISPSINGEFYNYN